MKSSIPLWCGSRIDAHVVRVQETDGELGFHILVPGCETTLTFRIFIGASETYRREVLTNIGKLVSELKEFAKQVENLSSEDWDAE